MKLIPVVLIPNINKKILNKPFYKYSLDIAFKINKEILIITNKKKIYYNFNTKKVEKYFIEDFNKNKIERILKKKLKHISTKLKGFILLNAKYPWRSLDVIKIGIKTFKTKKYDLIKSFSIAEENPFKIWYLKNRKLETVCRLKKEPESHSFPRQLLPITYIENGFFEIINKKYFEKKKIKTKIIKTHLPSMEINKNTLLDIEYLFKKEKINQRLFHSKGRLPS